MEAFLSGVATDRTVARVVADDLNMYVRTD